MIIKNGVCHVHVEVFEQLVHTVSKVELCADDSVFADVLHDHNPNILARDVGGGLADRESDAPLHGEALLTPPSDHPIDVPVVVLRHSTDFAGDARDFPAQRSLMFDMLGYGLIPLHNDVDTRLVVQGFVLLAL